VEKWNKKAVVVPLSDKGHDKTLGAVGVALGRCLRPNLGRSDMTESTKKTIAT
jgi:hypothetical protein